MKCVHIFDECSARWWRFFNKNLIARRLFLGASMWALLDVSAWGIRYADRALELGRADASTAGIIVAVGGPVTLLATAAFKIYAETIGKKPVEDDQ